VCQAILEEAAERTRTKIKLDCTMEIHRPFTMGSKEYMARKEEHLTSFALARHQNSDSSLPFAASGTVRVQDTSGAHRTFATSEENLLTVLAGYGIHMSSMKQLVRIHDDEYHAEMDVISHVAAYFDVSSKRIVDNVPMSFETVFARDFGKDLRRCLTTNLKLVGAHGVENCERYIRDEPNLRARRDELTRQLEILKSAMETVSGIM